MLDEIAAELGWDRRAEPAPNRRSSTTCGCAPRSASGSGRSPGRRGCSAGRLPTDALAALRRGDIINITQGRRGGLAVVLEAAHDADDPASAGADRKPLGRKDFLGRLRRALTAPLGSMSLPKRVEHRQPRVRRDLASALRRRRPGLVVPVGPQAARRARTSGRHRPGTGVAARGDAQAPGAPDRPTGRPRCASVSAICGWNATTSRSATRSAPRPTRWPARSTGSSGC